MKDKKLSTFSSGLIWFGAAVSIAEILTGTLIAPLGFTKGIIAILVGHLIGCSLFFLAGLIGANTSKSSMDTVKISFGKKGSILFSLLNVLQLLGWTSIMIISGATAANLILPIGSSFMWSIAIGGLISLWITVGVKKLNLINTIAMTGLFVLTILLSLKVFNTSTTHSVFENISFGAAIELSIAMPLSWLPLISDYTSSAKRPLLSTITSSIVYFVTSSWMYIIGLGAAIFAGTNDIISIMINSGLGISALLIVIFSTVTTTYLDAYSAGVSLESIYKGFNSTKSSILICILGTLLAIFIPITKYESFLFLIGSVFVPMISILIVDYYILKKDSSAININVENIIIWILGFIIYRVFMKIDTPIGYTIPSMIITGIISILYNIIFKTVKYNKSIFR